MSVDIDTPAAEIADREHRLRAAGLLTEGGEFRRAARYSAGWRRLRELTGWVALTPETDAQGVRRCRWVNLGPGAIYQVTASIYPLPGDGVDATVAGIYHAAGVQYLDAREARDLVDYLDVIAER